MVGTSCQSGVCEPGRLCAKPHTCYPSCDAVVANSRLGLPPRDHSCLLLLDLPSRARTGFLPRLRMMTTNVSCHSLRMFRLLLVKSSTNSADSWITSTSQQRQ